VIFIVHFGVIKWLWLLTACSCPASSASLSQSSNLLLAIRFMAAAACGELHSMEERRLQV
jgi:hypothetical protein